MADAFTSALVGHFVSRALERIEQEVGMVKNVKDDVKILKKRLSYIQDLLADAGTRQLDSNWLKHWLSDLEDLSYNIDNVLDEWNSAILKSQIDKQQEGDDGESSTAVPPKQVCFPVLSSCLCFKQANEVIRHRDFAKRIKDLNEELDRIKKEGQDYGLVLGAIRQGSQQQNATRSVGKPKDGTISLIDESEIYGRKEEREILVSKLLGESRKRIDIIPIIGMGGLGKTTLAQLAYNDDNVKTHFDKRIWVCVSDPFDLIQISKAIIEALGGDTQNCEQLETLVQRICESIGGKKFLLVLDDVWTEEKEKWEKLKKPLNHGVEGSKILVTTRKEKVAKMMGATKGMITPEILSDGDCWAIIKQLAFVEGEDEEINELEEIGRKIVSKCKGLPLYAKILGSLMSFKKSKSEWEEILHNKLWESHSAEDQIFAPFLLSYYDLPPLEKCCFSYCSIFPKDYKIERDILIDLWMSQGYIGDFKKGQECFESLVMRSFFQDFEKSECSGAIISCKMHDIMHDFAQLLTKNKSIIVEGDSIKETTKSLQDKACHLTFLHVNSESSNEVLIFKDIDNNFQNKLRTLLYLSTTEVDYEFVFSKFKGLRAFSTPSDDWERGVKLPENFATLIHLRYLDMSNSNFTELPETLYDLCNLQTLKMVDCHKLQRLPEGIEKLVNLRHLYVDGCWMLEGLPKGIGKITGLQKLDALVIPENKEAYFHFGDVKKCNHYQFQGNLSIERCRNFRNADEAEKISLIEIKDLDELTLRFGKLVDNIIGEDPQNEDMILEALKPHPNLKYLLINKYGGTTFPSWLTSSLFNLRCLCLWFCPNCEILPPLGKLPYLESLRIGIMGSVKKVGDEFLGISKRDEEDDSFISFPKLKKLAFSELPQWKEWEGNTAATGGSSLKIMPCLRELNIYMCLSLEALPDFLRMIPLQHLSISYCGILEESFQKGMGKEWLKNSHFSNIKIGIEYVQKDGIWVQKDDDDDEEYEGPSDEVERDFADQIVQEGEHD